MRQLLATLRHRPAPLVGIFVALLAAASVTTWAFSLGNSGSTARLPAQRLASTAVVVTGQHDVTFTHGHGTSATTSRTALTNYRRLPATLATTLAAIPGVRAAVPEESIPLALQLPGGRAVTGTSAQQPVTGYSWSSAQLTPFTLSTGHAPTSKYQLVIGAALARSTGLRLGDQLHLAGRPLGPFTVVGIAAAPGHNPAGESAVFLTQPEADALYGHPGQADLIGVLAQPGTDAGRLADRISSAVAGQHLSVATGTGRGAVENLAAANDLANLTDLGGGAGVDLILISLFVVASTVALSVAERARTMALLRAIGATPGQVRRMVMLELAILGVLAGLVGYLPGTWLASFSVHGLASHQVVPASTQAWSSPILLIPSIAFTVLVAQLSGWFAARRASRIRPTTALQEAIIERRYPRPLRLILGLAALGGGGVLSVWAIRQPDASQQLEQAQYVLLAFMAGIAFLGPYLISLAEALLRLPLRSFGGAPARLASAEVRTRSRRMAAAAVAIALPVCFAGAVCTVDATQAHASVTQGRQRLAASAVLTAPGPGLDPSALAAITARPGVTAAVGLVPTTVYLPYPEPVNTSAEAVTAGPLTSLLHLDVTSGSLDHFGPGDIALSALVAGKGGMNVRVGQRITSYLADGTTYQAKVAAIFARSLGFADALVPSGAAGGGHLGTTTLGQVLVGAPATVDVTKNLTTIAGSYPGLQVASRTVANAQDELLTTQTSYNNNLLLALIGLLAAIALANTLVMTSLQGRDQLTLLGRVGATVRQLLAMSAWQAIQVTLVGIILGAAAATVGVIAVAKAFTGAWTPAIPWTSVIAILAAVIALTATATLGPTAKMLTRTTNS